jgi:hypothetical protein
MWQEHLEKQNRTLNPGLAEVLNYMTKDLVSERYQTAQEVLNDLQKLPKLEGSVPGWVSSQASPSLFVGLTQPPLSGPGRQVGMSLPTTSPPHMETPTGAGVTQPHPRFLVSPHLGTTDPQANWVWDGYSPIRASPIGNTPIGNTPVGNTPVEHRVANRSHLDGTPIMGHRCRL